MFLPGTTSVHSVSCKAVKKYKGPKICFSCTKNGVFFTAGSLEKDIILMQLKQIFGPSYFDRVYLIAEILMSDYFGHFEKKMFSIFLFEFLASSRDHLFMCLSF